MARPSDRFKQTITFAAVTGRDVHGKPALGAVATVAARVQPYRKVIRDSMGQEFLASHVIYTEASITPAHRIWLPGENTADLSKARKPAAIDELVDGDGVEQYRKVYL